MSDPSMTLPTGWTVETETVDIMRLRRPPLDDEKAAAYFKSEGYAEARSYIVAASSASPEFTVDTAERPSRAVPLAELLAWLEGCRAEFGRRDRDTVALLHKWAAEKWGEERA